MTASLSQAHQGLYAESAAIKSARLVAELSALTVWHQQRCAPYSRILRALYGDRQEYSSLEELPFLPVRLFKMTDLVSVPSEDVVKTLTSSGTSGQRPSRIFLDKETSMSQTKALTTIMTSYLGPKRLPMAIIDSTSVLKDRNMFSARGAGILGFSPFGRDHVYFLNSSLELDIEAVERFADKHAGKPVLLFGFTYIIWRYFFQECVCRGIRLDFGDNSSIVHGGGWKKLQAEQVSNDGFKLALKGQFGIRHVYNYYGMVEQTGSIFMECEQGYFHPARFSDVLVRDPASLDVVPVGTTGLLQVMSTIPRSYPGHVLLTEDLGVIKGVDDCDCGRRGKYFHVSGRLPEIGIAWLQRHA